jgi:hypothetical protein
MTERLSELPEICPKCGRDNNRTGFGGVATGWHHYKRVPGAPAAGCGACGHIVYLSPEAYGGLRDTVREELPRAAAGTERKKFGRRRHARRAR